MENFPSSYLSEQSYMCEVKHVFSSCPSAGYVFPMDFIDIFSEHHAVIYCISVRVFILQRITGIAAAGWDQPQGRDPFVHR